MSCKSLSNHQSLGVEPARPIIRSELACHHATFPSPHQTIGSEENQADFGVIKYYGWKKVTIFQLDVDLFENVRLSPGFDMLMCATNNKRFLTMLTM